MRELSLLIALLCAATSVVNSQQSTKAITALKPDSGSFVQNTYRNESLGFSYPLSREWVQSKLAAAPLPSGAYYLFIGDRDIGHSLKNRVMVIADAESNYRSGLSLHDYVSAIVRAQVTHANAEVMREPAPFVLRGVDFYRADYKRMENGIPVYNSLVCIKRNGYWLSWNFVAPSKQDLDDEVDTLQRVSFGQKPTPAQRSR